MKDEAKIWLEYSKEISSISLRSIRPEAFFQILNLEFKYAMKQLLLQVKFSNPLRNSSRNSQSVKQGFWGYFVYTNGQGFASCNLQPALTWGVGGKVRECSMSVGEKGNA